VATSQTTTSLTYTDLATVGPSVTLTLPAGATKALVVLTAAANGSVGNSFAFMSVAVSGASTVPPSDANAYAVAGNDPVRASATVLISGLSSAGSLTFTAKYRVSSGTATFSTRDITVLPVP
jgi:hypothetical protein